MSGFVCFESHRRPLFKVGSEKTLKFLLIGGATRAVLTPSLPGVSALGVPGVPWHPQILADQLTPSQPGGTDYAHLILLAHPDFQTFRRPCAPVLTHSLVWYTVLASSSCQVILLSDLALLP